MTLDDHSLAAIGERLARMLDRNIAPRPRSSVHGGCINNCYRWESADGSLFVKVAEADRLPMLEAEAAGLTELAGANAVRVPKVLALGVAGQAFLALEWIEIGDSSPAASARLGEQLARQHRMQSAQFGWSRNNTIGSTAQVNSWTKDWPTFFREHRLRFQLELAYRNGHAGRLRECGERLLARVDEFFEDHRPAPSLLHGDLWGGNFAADLLGTPVIFDPAVYYGDREADIAMTRLFGGFSRELYSAYEAAWPLPSSARERVQLYNLYHVLNHVNLFGGGYLRQAEEIIDRLLARPAR